MAGDRLCRELVQLDPQLVGLPVRNVLSDINLLWAMSTFPGRPKPDAYKAEQSVQT